MSENDVCLQDFQRMICDENLIGAGNFNFAYSIPNCEDYILRVTKYDIDGIKEADFSKAQFKIVEDGLDINIGQKVASIEIPTIYPIPMEIQILKKQAGEAIGVQPPETLCKNEWGELRDGFAPYEDYSRKERYERTLQKVADLPVEAYEELLIEFEKASRTGYRLDYLNSNNLLVDDKQGKINLIDMEKYGIMDNYAGLLYGLTNAQYYRTYCDKYYNPVSDLQREKATENTITIIKKFVTAMRNQGLKFNRVNTPYEASKDLFNGFPCWKAFGVMSEQLVWECLYQMGVAE